MTMKNENIYMINLIKMVIKSTDNLENFVFYETFFLTLQRIKSKKVRCEAYDILVKFWLFWEIPDKFDNEWIQQLMEIAVPLIEKAKRRRNINTENGKKWGAPIGNKNAVKNLDNIVKQQTTEQQAKNNLNINIKKNISIKNNIHKENEVDNETKLSELDNKEKQNEIEEIKDNSEVDIEKLIDSIIETSKSTIEKCWWVYDSKNERKFAKELLTNKDVYQWRQEHYKCTLNEFIINTINASYISYNYPNRVDSLFKLFYNYQSIYNNTISSPKEDKNIKYTFYINHYHQNNTYVQKRKAIADFVTKNIPLPR